MKKILKALLVVDIQNDFCPPEGALAVPDGDKVIEPTNRILLHAQEKDWLILASRDWHPENTKHFQKFGGKWPVHCVRNTDGAAFHPLLNLPRQTVVISKGMGNEDDGYSLFEGLCLQRDDWPFSPVELLPYHRERYIREVYICGLATDYCVRATALDAVKKGLEFKTYLLLDACRAVNVNPNDSDKAIEEMRRAGVIITTTDKVINGQESS